MSTSVSPALQAALTQMRELAAQAGPADAPRGERFNATVGSGGFSDALQSSLERINQLQQDSAASARAFQAGEPGVELHDVMITGQKASIAFEMGVQMRNRLVNAYKDIMNMQV
ncbi:flagellar hook-basal body complex protein FliE [Alloalcanivorax gelatiniphagus]|uniref:Flagellar hook-basal body complex protein FliE n=1 Tax=Alloalcanivorax gelatiniphagus TaxID=1194167 RepID=A0ABY2XFR1_9GAMM|nr:flagellar hook-basal body complex protein FliE [Alloalcanivorax gelatiniphagus]TMW10441.1 flagellar hook-basal body complex protein FliE [Alloalcanivorax gelatiniphagus]